MTFWLPPFGPWLKFHQCRELTGGKENLLNEYKACVGELIIQEMNAPADQATLQTIAESHAF